METGRIDHGFYVQGDIKFAVDATDARKTFDAVAALSNADKIKLAKLNNIPAEPFNKRELTEILQSTVQNAWFANRPGGVPAEVLTAHSARLARYVATLAVPSSSVDFLSRKTRAVSKTRKVLLYTIDPVKYEEKWKGYRSQAYLTIKTLIDLGGVNGVGKSRRDIFDNCNETRETTKPTSNAIGQVLNRLIADGIVRCLNPEDARERTSKKGEKKTITSKDVGKLKLAPTTKKK